MAGPLNDSNPDWVRRLGLQPHPEGGWFRRIYTASRCIASGGAERPLASSIHYLLRSDSALGRLHRNDSDILHLIQSGGPIEYLLYRESQAPQRVELGFGADQQLSLLVPGGTWKASRLRGAGHGLVTELVVPGFDWSEHRYADPAWLAQQPPAYRAQLARYLGCD